jgi:hypothetical protein
MSVADYIVERIANEGVTRCFGDAGDYLFPRCNAPFKKAVLFVLLGGNSLKNMESGPETQIWIPSAGFGFRCA